MLEVHWHQGRRANIMSRVLPAESLETAPGPVHRRLRSDKEEGDEGPRWFLRPGPDVVLLVSVAIIARVFLWLLQPAAWYFSDSGDYIATFGWKPYSDNRSPALSWLWHIGTAFDYTERSVVLLQMALGVISVIALFDLLRRMVSRRRAFVVALAWAVFPLALVFERTLMPESVCSVLFILFLWLTTVAFLSPSERWRAIPAIGATFVLSLIFVIIPSLELACVVIAVMLFVVAWHGTSARRGHWGLAARGSLVVAMVVAFLLPVAAVTIENKETFGVVSLHPVSGTELFARWAPLVSCRQASGLTPLVKGSVHEECRKPFTSVPGENIDAIWKPRTPLNLSLEPFRDIGATQGQLTRLAEQAMLSHPGAVLAQVSESLFYQLFMPPYNDIYQYNNGNSWMRVSRRHSSADTAADWRNWWGSSATRGRSRVSLFQTIAQASYRWPQFLLWALLLALVVRAIARTPGRSRRTSDVEDLSTARAEPETWTVQPRLAVVAASSILIVGSFLAVALAGFPVFRYQVTLVPATLVLLAFATQFHPNDRRVAGEPGPRRVAPLTHRGQHAAPAH